jgi:hypothetical protein
MIGLVFVLSEGASVLSKANFQRLTYGLVSLGFRLWEVVMVGRLCMLQNLFTVV